MPYGSRDNTCLLNARNGCKSENFSKEFLAMVFEQIVARNLSVVPTSPEIAKFVRGNRKYKRMLPVGLRI